MSLLYPSTNRKCPIDVGEIVILKSDKSARAFWNLAKVEELITSKDGVVRAARVRVVNQDNGKSTVLREVPAFATYRQSNLRQKLLAPGNDTNGNKRD